MEILLGTEVLARNPVGDYLLLHRVYEPYKGLWWPVGGKINAGETARDAVTREFREETGLGLFDIQPLGYREDIFGDEYHLLVIVFNAQINFFFNSSQELPITLNDEHDGWRFDTKPPPQWSACFYGRLWV